MCHCNVIVTVYSNNIDNNETKNKLFILLLCTAVIKHLTSKQKNNKLSYQYSYSFFFFLSFLGGGHIGRQQRARTFATAHGTLEGKDLLEVVWPYRCLLHSLYGVARPEARGLLGRPRALLLFHVDRAPQGIIIITS